ncbi:Eukaryotic/viral aspartic protease [Phytophthora cinnamomi]|uniref:Eukaryotic/viral aspartic protease n=1 Tax=Phytophthora cinnamomi TaxID=4785 RepID=UPI00355A3C26|nr:Eukaryotic/viral aspartic protease [Phytophthora cinnamomi]
MIKQEPRVDAPSIGRSSTASEQERPDASWSSEGTFTTGHGASDEHEGYDEQFAVPDVAPHGATPDLGSRRGPTGLKPEKAEDQNPPTTKAAAKRKPKKKKKLRAPESADEELPKTGGKNAGRQYTEEELDYVLGKTQLARLLERDPILRFVRPKLINELTGPIQEPDWESITDVRMAVHALFGMLFGMLRESVFVLGAFEMERVFDWELASWKDSIKAMMGPLAGLVGMVKREAKPPRVDQVVVPPPLLRPQYQSSVGSASSIESPKRMPMPGRPPRIMQLTTAPTRTETPSPEENVIPRALEDAIIRLMRSTMMRTTSVPTRTEPAPTVRTMPQVTTPREPADVAMESVSSRSTPRSKRQARDQDEDPENLFDLEPGTPGTAAAASTATAGTGLTRAAAKRKLKKKKKKKLRAPESADEELPKTGGKNAGRQYTEEELDYVLDKTQLARLLERDPILSFVRPKLINELTGPIQEPDWESITDVRMAVHALFGMLHESGFVLGAFEMERVFDWEPVSWKDSIKAMMGPLAGLVGMVKREAKPPRVDPGVVPPLPLIRPQYQSSVGSDSSIESPKRMPMPGRPPLIMQLTAAPTRTETPSPERNEIPKALEDAVIRLMRSTMMRTTSVPTRTEPAPTVRTTPQATTPREPADVAMESGEDNG